MDYQRTRHVAILAAALICTACALQLIHYILKASHA